MMIMTRRLAEARKEIKIFLLGTMLHGVVTLSQKVFSSLAFRRRTYSGMTFGGTTFSKFMICKTALSRKVFARMAFR